MTGVQTCALPISSPSAPEPHGRSSNRHEIRVPCAGKLQPEHLLKAFEQGASLVLVVTCAEGQCRYLEGDLRVRRRVDHVRSILNDIGLGGERIALLQATAEEQDGKIDETIASRLAGLDESPLAKSSEQEGK